MSGFERPTISGKSKIRRQKNKKTNTKQVYVQKRQKKQKEQKRQERQQQKYEQLHLPGFYRPAIYDKSSILAQVKSSFYLYCMNIYLSPSICLFGHSLDL